ncbi:MAG: carboxymuconolactone decarboxylase family protein [Pseudomonadota bacterium]
METTQSFNYEPTTPDVFQALARVHNVMDAYGLDRKLSHLVLLRASQINRCWFCVDLHTREAREDGETSERLDQVIVWDQSDLFSDKERAALAWTENLTILAPDAQRGALRDRLKAHFSKEEISVLTATIGMINLWNRIQVSRH